ncbi:class I SAM-dependent methyltransferase [Sphingobium boeckii]|uniref:Ubiquinone/menaquinone biosynthesis C-methylase UbiE n=1 Tax=Sphingobium boeckii TaxID=1082345 RepID=A0A7W9ED54_9SPHN|nr:class I SAM-dependent methyltransferase [Sphingobium boeckii]MBB5684933.1 ubiquinone/menaquinone biosynthesis C-methylase UbiE [Sphingobium boeckii]
MSVQKLAERRADLCHPLIAVPSHDELVEQLFVRDLKQFVNGPLEGVQAELADEEGRSLDKAGSNNGVADLRARMSQHQSFRTWLALKRESQRQLWATVGDSVERQAPQLEALAEIAAPRGSVRTSESFVPPDYILRGDIHLMPGGNAHDDGSLMQGAVMDRGGAVFMLGRNGGMLNDLRGQTAMAHVLTRRPDFTPERILDMGCGIGTSTVPSAQCFPDAEVHGIDVGASILRYAHARAEHLGAPVHFSQQSAERTDFSDASFDLVFSCVLFHETSQAAMFNILAESRRLLRPGGLAVHLEVPLLHDNSDTWVELNGELEAQYNNEPNWRGALTADYMKMMVAAGFGDVMTGYQPTSPAARQGPFRFGAESEGVFRSWFVASGTA